MMILVGRSTKLRVQQKTELDIDTCDSQESDNISNSSDIIQYFCFIDQRCRFYVPVKLTAGGR